MTLRPSFNMRLRQYTPLGAPGAVIPDMGFTIVSGPDGPTLSATFSSLIYQSLPDDVEVAVEVWANNSSTWTEGRDSRFVLLTQDADDRDRTGAITVTGVGLLQWLAGKAALAGVTPYSDAGNVEAVCTSTTVSVSGRTFTWSGHVLGEGDRIRITDSGKSKGLSSGSVYFVRNPSGSTFQVSHTATGAIKSYGSSHTIHAERVRTRIVNLNGHKFSKNMAISVWDANGQNLTNGSQYYVVNPTASSIQVADKPGGIPREFAVGDALTVYRYLDGARLFKNQTPGQIIGDSFLEARDRGWGQDASGNDQVFHSWSNAGDSNSLAWPARVDDPTITGVSVGFQPGTPLWDQIRFMVDNGWAEFASHGRTLDLFAPLTGTDYTVAGNVRRIGDAAQSVKVSKDLTDYRTTEIVRGDGPVEQRVSKPRSPWGVLEVYTTAAGVGSARHATSYGNGDLTKYSAPQVGYTVTEAAQEAAYLPILDYQRGDWVQVRLVSTWKRLRVTQWTFAKDTTGVVTVTVLLEAKKRHLLHKVAHASRKANGGRAATTTTTTPRESDARKGAKPSTLAVTTRTTTAQDKSARGTVTASWLPVTTDEDGNDLTGASYEVVVRVDGEQYGKTVAVTKHTTVDLPAHPAGTTLAVSVRAQSNTGAWGEATDEVEYVVALPEDSVPLSPSAPAVASTLGSITVTWDGNLTDPIDGAIPAGPSIAYVAAQRSADNGTTWVTVSQTLAQAGTLTDLGLAVGTAYQYRLVATSQTGGASAPSPVASATVVPVDTAQINAAFTKSVTDASNAAANAQQVANQSSATAGQASTDAANAQTAATNALNAANGKNVNHYSTGTPTGTGNAGDEWFQIDASGNVIKQWVWTVTNGTGAWASSLLTGSVVTNLDAGSISTGTLNSARIAAGSITVAQLAVTDLSNVYGNGTFAVDFNGRATYSYPFTGTPAAPKGNAWVIGSRDNIGGGFPVSVKAGDAFYIEADVLKVSGGTDVLTGGLWVANAAGGTDSPYSPYSTLNTVQGSGTVVDYGNGWTRRWWRFTIPTTWVTVDHGALYFQINTSTAGSTLYALGNVIVRRLNGGNLIVDGTINTSSLNATAIDSMTITGATFRTASTAKTSGGVQIDSTGLHGYNSSGVATFSLDTAGNITLTGTVHATGGTIDGALTVGSSGAVRSNQSAYPNFSLDTVNGLTLAGSSTNQMILNGSASGGAAGTSWYGPGLFGQMYGTLSGGLVIWGGDQSVGTGGDLTLNADSSGGYLHSAAVRNRVYGLASSTPSLSGSSSTGLVVVTSSGNLGMLQGSGAYLQMPDAYATVVTTRAVYVSSAGRLGTTSSSRRTKNLHRHLQMDDKALGAWLDLPTWEFEYKPEIAPDSPGIHHGLVAEEVHDAGFTGLVYYDDREGETKGQIDGFAYERMGVYNRMAIQRVYARLMAAENRLAALERKA